MRPVFCLLLIKYINRTSVFRQVQSFIFILYFGAVFFNVDFTTYLLNLYLAYQKETVGSIFALFCKSFFHLTCLLLALEGGQVDFLHYL